MIVFRSANNNDPLAPGKARIAQGIANTYGACRRGRSAPERPQSLNGVEVEGNEVPSCAGGCEKRVPISGTLCATFGVCCGGLAAGPRLAEILRDRMQEGTGRRGRWNRAMQNLLESVLGTVHV